MRNQFCEAMCRKAKDENFVFLTGDLGFMALEPLQLKMGDRFINCGISEQNMISVAAGLASENFEVWVYSIAPFIYARAFEQIRNDISFHGCKVRLVGNGGGYGYGVMGPTHHSIEDYGVLSSLPGLLSLIPAFDEDIPSMLTRVDDYVGPAYVRLGRGEYKPTSIEEFSGWRQILSGNRSILFTVGPLAGMLLRAFEKLPEATRPQIWAVGELPLALNPPPPALIQDLDDGNLVVVEEHISQGSLGMQMAYWLVTSRISPRNFKHNRFNIIRVSATLKNLEKP